MPASEGNWGDLLWTEKTQWPRGPLPHPCVRKFMKTKGGGNSKK